MLVYILILFSFSFCISDASIESTKSIQDSSVVLQVAQKSPLSYALSSLIVPGLGEFRLNKFHNEKKIRNRAMTFLGIEIVSWISALSYKSKYREKMSEYQSYADSDVGWDFERWVKDYSYFMENYPDVWSSEIGEGSHSVDFWLNDSRISTSEDSFDLIKDEMQQFSGDFYDNFPITLVRDQHFYENIGKYNEFFPGWSDAKEVNFETTEQGYVIALSPKKEKYIQMYDTAESLSDRSEVAVYCIYFNHFVSMIDAFILARKFNGDIMLSSSTVFDKNSYKMPIGVNLKLSLCL